MFARRRAQGKQVSNPEQGIGRRFQPQKVCVLRRLEPCGRVVDGQMTKRPEPLCLTLAREFRDAVITVVGQNDIRAGRQTLENGRSCRHARRKSDRFASLQSANDLLERLPAGGGAVAAVDPITTQRVIRYGDYRCVHWRPGGVRPAGCDQPGIGVQFGLFHGFIQGGLSLAIVLNTGQSSRCVPGR